MEKIWLATKYYLDTKLAGCSAATERMFTRLVAWSGDNETGGNLPEKPHKYVALPNGFAAVSELVSRGVLIEKEDGGYRLVGWTNWNSQADDLAQRKRADRERKRRQREKSEKPSRDMSRDVTDTEKSKRREGSYVTGEPHVTAVPDSPPPPRCPKHINEPTTAACRPCGEARTARTAWDADRRRADAEATRRANEQRAAAQAAAIDACGLCDQHGYQPGAAAPCNHDPGQSETNRRGIALVRAQLPKTGKVS